MSIAELELSIQDAIDDPLLAPEDGLVFQGIGRILREARRSEGVTLQQRSIIVIETKPRLRPSN